MFAKAGPDRSAAAWLVAAFALLFVFVMAPGAQAQLRPMPTPAVLTAVSVDEIADRGTKVLLTFSPKAPSYSIITNDNERPTIGFALSSRGASARIPLGLHGLLRTIDFDQNDTILILRLQAGAPAKLTATPVGDQSIALELTPSARTRSTDQVAQGGGPLPAASEPPPGEDGFELVPLKYADVSEIVGLLTDGLTVKPNDAFVPREPAFGSAGIGGNAGFAPPPAQAAEVSDQPLGQSVDDAIGIDRRLNAVILKGSPERIARMKARIAQIDVPVQSVILETIFVELTESGARNVGLDFNNANNQIGVATYQTGQFIAPGFPIDQGLSSAQFQAAIYAQVRAGHGRIVSKPRIAAQSGSSAKIITGDALPILTAITLSGVNGVSQQVQYVNVGVTLQIAPRVSSDGFVTSHVFCVVSSVTGFSQGYPTISQREAQTSATVRDGETFIIGGLTEENELSTRDKVPGLGDIPGVGELFRLHKGTHSKTELYIVVTPHIVKRGEMVPLPAPLQ
ncbi:MAG TPA: secretin N-terminal domain-containing protein [Caulobacteraceae bacterium]|nr:secretin N-terminal domain-containing protein [Caulobacteraceae bacterium]